MISKKIAAASAAGGGESFFLSEIQDSAGTNGGQVLDIARDSNDDIIFIEEDALVKMSREDGSIIWKVDPTTLNGDVYGVCLDPSDNIYVCGTTLSHAYVAKFNSSGTLQWAKEYAAASGNSILRAITYNNSYGLYTAGTWYDSSVSNNTPILMRLNPSSGVTQLTRYLYVSISSYAFDEVNDVAVDSSGYSYVVGRGATGSSYKYQSIWRLGYTGSGHQGYAYDYGSITGVFADGTDIYTVAQTGTTGSWGVNGAQIMKITGSNLNNLSQVYRYKDFSVTNRLYTGDISIDSSGNIITSAVEGNSASDYGVYITKHNSSFSQQASQKIIFGNLTTNYFTYYPSSDLLSDDNILSSNIFYNGSGSTNSGGVYYLDTSDLAISQTYTDWVMQDRDSDVTTSIGPTSKTSVSYWGSSTWYATTNTVSISGSTPLTTSTIQEIP